MSKVSTKECHSRERESVCVCACVFARVNVLVGWCKEEHQRLQQREEIRLTSKMPRQARKKAAELKLRLFPVAKAQAAKPTKDAANGRMAIVQRGIGGWGLEFTRWKTSAKVANAHASVFWYLTPLLTRSHTFTVTHTDTDTDTNTDTQTHTDRHSHTHSHTHTHTHTLTHSLAQTQIQTHRHTLSLPVSG